MTVTLSLSLFVNDRNFYSFCASKQGQGIHYGPDGLARGVPTDEDAADPRCRVVWRKEKDWSAGTQNQRFREAGRRGRLASGLGAGNNHEVCVVRLHSHLGVPGRQGSPFRPRDFVTTHNVVESRPPTPFDTLQL
jgi:hypothetical protein